MFTGQFDQMVRMELEPFARKLGVVVGLPIISVYKTNIDKGENMLENSLRRLALGVVTMCVSSALVLAQYQPPSFDCNRAVGAVERAICASPQLSALDAEMSDAWVNIQRALSPSDDQAGRRELLIAQLRAAPAAEMTTLESAAPSPASSLSEVTALESTAPTPVEAQAAQELAQRSAVAAQPDTASADDRARVDRARRANRWADLVQSASFVTWWLVMIEFCIVGGFAWWQLRAAKALRMANPAEVLFADRSDLNRASVFYFVFVVATWYMALLFSIMHYDGSVLGLARVALYCLAALMLVPIGAYLSFRRECTQIALVRGAHGLSATEVHRLALLRVGGAYGIGTLHLSKVLSYAAAGFIGLMALTRRRKDNESYSEHLAHKATGAAVSAGLFIFARHLSPKLEELYELLCGQTDEK